MWSRVFLLYFGSRKNVFCFITWFVDPQRKQNEGVICDSYRLPFECRWNVLIFIVRLKNLIYAVRVQAATNRYLQQPVTNYHARHEQAAFCIKDWI